MAPTLYLVVGLGKTGHSIAQYLQRKGLAFALFDTRENPSTLLEVKKEFSNVDVYLQSLPLKVYEQLSAVICSPGVDLEHEVLQRARSLNIPIYGDIECLVREINVPIIAITGTNGKSTVTTLVGEMAKASGLSVAVAGNIGTPVLDVLSNSVPYDVWVLELSSFQLELTQSLAARAATILNITPDHLDRHHSFEAYCQAKHQIYKQASFVIYNREDETTYPRLSSATKRCSFGLNPPEEGSWGIIWEGEAGYLAFGQERILNVNDLRIKGKHNWMNALAASALALSAQIDLSCIVHVLKTFEGLPHRSQWVRTHRGIDWINDSKGTNVGATISAILGLKNVVKGKLVLIAGGQGKGADFSLLRECMTDAIRCVVLMGEDADKIEQALEGCVDMKRVDSLENAVSMANNCAQLGDTVLLSPACASFDMFRDYVHRGEMFTSLVNALP